MFQQTASAVSVSLILLCAKTAFSGADDKQEAKKHFEIATRLYEVEDYKGAAAEFETSVSLYPTKNGYFNLANCYKALHRYEDALFAIEQLETRFADTIDRTMRRKADELKALIDGLVGELTVFVSPIDAEVRLNGKRLPERRFGSPVQLGPGEYLVEARRDGYKSYSRRIKIHSQKKQQLEITLSSETGTLSVNTNIEGATVVVDGALEGETPLTLTVSPGEHLVEVSLDGYSEMVRTVMVSPDRKEMVNLDLAFTEPTSATPAGEKSRVSIVPALKIAGIASTATTAVLSGVFYGLAAKNASDFHGYDDDFVNAPDVSESAKADSWRLDAKEKTELFAALGLAFGVTAGVLCASTVVWVVLSKRWDEKDSHTRVSLDGGGLTVSF